MGATGTQKTEGGGMRDQRRLNFRAKRGGLSVAMPMLACSCPKGPIRARARAIPNYIPTQERAQGEVSSKTMHRGAGGLV